MDTVFLYAGQGSQKPGMGLDFYEQYPRYRAAADAVNPGFDHLKLMHEGPSELLSRTEYTQFCMGVFQAGVTELLLDAGVKPAAACGLSLGEYGALLAAGVFSVPYYLELLQFRGEAMAEAAKGLHCCMSAVLGPDCETVRAACDQYNRGAGRVTVANCNCPGQTVICGDEESVAAAEALLREKGARRFVHLQVSGPFHTPYMAPAGDALRQKFASMQLRAPEIPVAMNVTGWFYDSEEELRLRQDPQGIPGRTDREKLTELLVRQVQSTVLLEQDLRTLLEAGYTDFTEIGPGNTMAGFLKKTAKAVGKTVTVRSIESAEDFRAAVQALREN